MKFCEAFGEFVDAFSRRFGIVTSPNFSVLLLIIKLTLASSLYDPNDDVVDLTLANFDSLVTEDSGGAWMVNFYAPWCELKKNLWKAFLICWCEFNLKVGTAKESSLYTSKSLPTWKGKWKLAL